MLKPYISRQDAIVPEHSVAPLTCVLPVAVAPAYCPKQDGLRDQLVTTPTARLENSKILAKLDEYLSHLCMTPRGDVCALICDNLELFGDKPTKPIKQHLYQANPTKGPIMSQEVESLLQNSLATPSSSPSLVVPKSDQTPRFSTD